MIVSLYDGRYEIECGTAALEVPFQKISTCVQMKIAVGQVPSNRATSLDTFCPATSMQRSYAAGLY